MRKPKEYRMLGLIKKEQKWMENKVGIRQKAQKKPLNMAH